MNTRRPYSNISSQMALLLVLAHLAGPPAFCGEEFLFRFYRHVDVPLKQKDVDALLEQATELFANSRCNAVLSRCGSVRDFGVAHVDAIVDSSASLMALEPPPTTGERLRDWCELVPIPVKVVKEIKWCEGKYQPVAGCTGHDRTGQTSFIVLARGPIERPLGSVVMAHEFGHTRGLPNLPGNTVNFMGNPLTDQNRQVSPKQCMDILDPKTLPGANKVP
jgi:hypothetical protein